MGRLILGLIISIAIIIGGLSGSLVLRGTNSSELLVAFGVVYLIFDVYKIIKYQRNNR